MPRAVETTTNSPFAKLVDLGDTLVGAFAGSAQRQIVNFKTRLPEWKDEEKKVPKREEIMHFIAMPGTTAKLGKDETGYTPIELDTHLRYSASGFKWGQIIEGRKNLPAAHGFVAGQICSSDVYTFSIVGWSASTEGADVAKAREAGFTIEHNRFILRSQEQKDQYVLARSRKNQPTGVGVDLEIAIRRIALPNEQRWADLADELYDTKPWEGGAGAAGGGGEYVDDGAPHPADTAADEPEEEPF